MRNVVKQFLAENTILLMRKWNHACSLLVYVISVITPGRQLSEDNKLSDWMIKQLTTPENTITYHNTLCLSPQNFA